MGNCRERLRRNPRLRRCRLSVLLALRLYDGLLAPPAAPSSHWVDTNGFCSLYHRPARGSAEAG